MKIQYLLALLIILPLASASFNRTVEPQINPGQQFAVTYNADSTAPWYLTFKDEVTGGCTPNVYEDNAFSETQTKKIIKIYTAPNENTTCTFKGSFMFANTPQTFLPTVTIQIGEKQTIAQTINTIDCLDNQERCNGNITEICRNKVWVNNGTVLGKCGFSNGTIKSDCMYTIKGYCIKSWYLLVGIGVLAFIMLSGKK